MVKKTTSPTSVDAVVKQYRKSYDIAKMHHPSVVNKIEQATQKRFGGLISKTQSIEKKVALGIRKSANTVDKVLNVVEPLSRPILTRFVGEAGAAKATEIMEKLRNTIHKSARTYKQGRELIPGLDPVKLDFKDRERMPKLNLIKDRPPPKLSETNPL